MKKSIIIGVLLVTLSSICGCGMQETNQSTEMLTVNELTTEATTSKPMTETTTTEEMTTEAPVIEKEYIDYMQDGGILMI